MKIRQTNLEDAQAIFDIQKETWLNVYPNDEYGISYQDIIKKFSNEEEILNKIRIWLGLYGRDSHGWVAVDDSLNDNNVVGFSRTYKEEGRIMLGAIYVSPKYQRQGVGKLLLEKVLEFHRGKQVLGEQAIWLTVAVYNKKAINFYKKAGFEIVKDSEGNHKIGEGKFIQIVKMKIVI